MSASGETTAPQPRRAPVRIDVVVAVRDEAATLESFAEQLRGLDLPEGVALGAIFVEDSSTDGTRPLLRRLAAEDPALAYHALERGFGQGPAIVFGLSRSSADAVVMMDVDGGHPVATLPGMIDRFMAGADVVQCKRRVITGRRRYRDLGSAAFQPLTRWLSGVDVRDQVSYFRLVSADVARQLVADPLTWRFLRFRLPSLESGRLAIVEFDAAERTRGESKYGPLRLMTIAIDGFLSLIPARRLVDGAAGLLLAALALAWLGLGALAVLLAAGAVAAVWRARRLKRDDTLTRMHVVETSESGSA